MTLTVWVKSLTLMKRDCSHFPHENVREISFNPGNTQFIYQEMLPTKELENFNNKTITTTYHLIQISYQQHTNFMINSISHKTIQTLPNMYRFSKVFLILARILKLVKNLTQLIKSNSTPKCFSNFSTII